MILTLAPHEFSPEHVEYLKQYQDFIRCLTIHNRELIMGVKDINSRYLITNDAHAVAVGMKCGKDMIGLTDGDMACKEIASYCHQYQTEDQQIIRNMDLNSTYTYLKVHHYADGFKARIIKKSVMYHKESNVVLGISFNGYEIKLSSLFSLMPNYANLISKSNIAQQRVSKKKYSVNGISLTQYEYEICYLLTIGWGYGEIADFLNKHNFDNKSTRNADTIKKVKNTICRKLGLFGHVSYLREMLMCFDVHIQAPCSILQYFSGSRQIDM